MKKALFVLLALMIMSLTASVAFANGGTANFVSYLDEYGIVREQSGVTRLIPPTPGNPLPNPLTSGWFVVEGNVTYLDRVVVQGNVNLILGNSGHLNATQGINVSQGNSLTIFAQSAAGNAGRLTATGTSWQSGIGGNTGNAGGNIAINGGYIIAIGDAHSAGIGGGRYGNGGNITIRRGSVTARSIGGGAGIGGGDGGNGGIITITGGNVNATSDGGSAAIGGGFSGHGGQIRIDGGYIAAIGGGGAAGIGGGSGGWLGNADAGEITITGGNITVTAGLAGAGIGGGYLGNGGTITITGGIIEAIASDWGNAAAIGRGGDGADGVVRIVGAYYFETNIFPSGSPGTAQAGLEEFDGTIVTHIPLSGGRPLNTLKYVRLEPAELPEGGPLGEVPVGDRVYIRENGVLVPFIVVQQGRPAGLLPNGNINRPAVPPDNMFVRNTTQITAYANWTYSTIVMRERVINPIRMGRTLDRTGNVFRHSDVFAWLNDTYFTWLNQPVRDAVINKTIPVVQCSGQYLSMDRQARPPHIGNMTQRLWISNMNARVWIPNAAEVGVPWHLDNANPASGFPNTLSVLHWMPGAGTTRAGWDNAIRFEYFPFGHGQNPTRPLAAIASEARIAYCDDDIPRLWWTRCPGHQPVGGAFGTAVSEVGQGVRRFYTTLGWVRPTMGFPQSLVLGPGNEITGIGAATAPLAAMEYVFPEFTTGPALSLAK